MAAATGMSVDLVTFGCRLNAYESEVIRAQAQAAGLARRDTIVVNTCAVTAEATRQARQAIRKLRRERPGARIVVTGCAAQVEPAELPRHARGRSRARQCREARRGDLARHAGAVRAAAGRSRTRREGGRQRHHGGDRDGAAAHRRVRRPRPRLRAGAERLRSPLHVLHHSVRPRQFALGAHGRGGRSGAPAGRARLSRGGAHRRRSHQLWGGPARNAAARHAGEADPQARARARCGCGCHRSIRSRPTATCSMRSPTTPA